MFCPYCGFEKTKVLNTMKGSCKTSVIEFAISVKEALLVSKHFFLIRTGKSMLRLLKSLAILRV